MKRFATAHWNGTAKEGEGKLTTQSKTLEYTSYTFASRFEKDEGTNPEELLASAHAGCFSMKLSANLDEAGYPEKEIETNCHIQLEDGAITESLLEVEVFAPGLEDTHFKKLVEDAKENCPVSQLFDAKIKLEARIVDAVEQL